MIHLGYVHKTQKSIRFIARRTMDDHATNDLYEITGKPVKSSRIIPAFKKCAKSTHATSFVALT